MKTSKLSVIFKKAPFPAIMTIIFFILFIGLYWLATARSIEPYYFVGLLFGVPFLSYGIITFFTVTEKMKVDVFSFYKRILITQSLSILFAVISNFHTSILINRDWTFDNPSLFLQIILLVIIFSVVIIRYLDGRWINVLLISIPYIVYWFKVLAIASTIFPTHTDSEDYGAGLIILFVSACQWISVVIGSIAGTYIKKRTHSFNK